MNFISKVLGYILLGVNGVVVLALFLSAYSYHIDPQVHPVWSCAGLFFPVFLLLNLLLIPGLPNQLMTTMSLAVTLLTLTIWSFMRYYIYLMMITFRLTLKQLLKNAFIFCWAGFLRNLFITLIIAALVYFGYMYLGFFYMLFVVLVILFSLCGFLVIFTVYPLVKKHMMDGYDPETGDRIDDEGYEGFSDSNE